MSWAVVVIVSLAFVVSGVSGFFIGAFVAGTLDFPAPLRLLAGGAFSFGACFVFGITLDRWLFK